MRGHRVSNCQHSDRPLQHINKKVCVLKALHHFMLTSPRAVQCRNAPTVELCENLALHTSVVSVARRHILKERAKEIFRVSFSWEICGITTAVSDHIMQRTTVVAAMALVALVP